MNGIAAASAAPQVYQDNSTLGLLATAFHKGALKRIAKTAADSPQAAALFALQRDMSEGTLTPSPAWWQPELGAAMACAERGDGVAAALHALFAVHAQGVAGSWRTTLARPVRLSIAGHVFDGDGELDVCAAADALEVRCVTAGRTRVLRLVRGATGWRRPEAAPPDAAWRYAAPAFLARAGCEACYLQPWRADANSGPVPCDWPPHYAEAVPADPEAACVDAALALLARAGAAYLPYIMPLLRGICATVPTRAEVHNSGSSVLHAGVVYCSFPVRPAALAEALVHEVSHQHFLLVNGVIPLVKRTEIEAKYFSSFKGQKRNLGKILLTYHATANMTLFWHDLIGVDPAGADGHARERDGLLVHTRSLGQVLTDSDGLSEAGQAMFATQAALLDERGYAAPPAWVPAVCA